MFGRESQDDYLALLVDFLRFAGGILIKSHCSLTHDRKVSKMLGFVPVLRVLEVGSLAVNTNIL
jgi:hypothetical protein